MNAHEQRQLISRFYDDMWNRFDKTVFSDILDPDIRFRGSLGHDKVGYAELGDYVDVIQTFSPDFHNTVLTTITEDDRTFARLSYTGTTGARSSVSSPPDALSSTQVLPCSRSSPTESHRSGCSATSTACSGSCADLPCAGVP